MSTGDMPHRELVTRRVSMGLEELLLRSPQGTGSAESAAQIGGENPRGSGGLAPGWPGGPSFRPDEGLVWLMQGS